MNVTTRMQQSVSAALRRLQYSFFEPPSAPAGPPPSSWSRNQPWSTTKRPDTAHSPAHQSTRPLRVLRYVESGLPRASVGRMVISGRMADVCAELDRMVAQELASH